MTEAKSINATPNKTQKIAVWGAIFMMATSSVGPAFLTQTSLFTEKYLASFAFAILLSLIIDVAAQLNIWRVISVSNLRGQEVANRVLPGAGHLISILIVLGGLAFNIGNIGGAGLAMNVIFGVPIILGSLIAGLIIITIFMLRNAMRIMDFVVQFLGLLMLVMIGYVMLQSNPPVQQALLRSVSPDDPLLLLLPIVTLVGGTVGGYISFSGGHRLLDAGITGIGHVRTATRAAVIGIMTTGTVRICLFLATLGVVSQGIELDPNNPAAAVFSSSLGMIGYKVFGLVLLAASISSVIGCAYTSVSFTQSWHPWIARQQKYIVVGFIAFSTAVYCLLGQPVKILVIAGALNAFVLPIALACMLIAAKRVSIVGSEYRHPNWLLVLGALTVVVTSVGVVMSFEALMKFWAS